MSNRSPISIVCATDDAYVPYCGIMLTSLFYNNCDESINVYVITKSLSDAGAQALYNLAEKYKQSISILQIDDTLLDGVFVRNDNHISIATYYRFLAPVLLPNTINKALYLDCDLIINDSIRTIWETDLEGKAIAATIDESYYIPEFYSRLKISPSNKYINAGVLLLNLDYWRRNNIFSLCINYIRSFPERLLFYDQDVINAVMNDKVSYLPIKANLQNGFLYTWQWGYYEKNVQEEIWSAVLSPSIIHFDGSAKPWCKECYHPYKSYFNFYKGLSPWADLRKTGKWPLKNRIKHFIRGIAVKMHIKDSSFIIQTMDHK